jgi:hypothetical protein
MEMQTGTGSTNNLISGIFIVFAAPMCWWDLSAGPVLMVRYKGDYHVSSTNPNRQLNGYWTKVSGKGNKIIPRWRPNKNRKDIYHHGPRPISIICHLSDLSDPSCFSLVSTFKPCFALQANLKVLLHT